MQDDKIVDLYFARDEQAIAATSAKYNTYCMNIAMNILHNREDSEECVNDTLLAAWNSIPPHKPESLRAFVGRITRRLALNMCEKASAQKRGKGTVQLVLDELSECIPDTGGDTVQGFVITDALNIFLASLPEENRNIFVRRYWYMSAVKDIAADYGMSESKVKMRLPRTRTKLANYLNKEGIGV